MAKAIKQIEKRVPNEAEEQTEALGSILKAATENRAALLQMIDIVGELHKAGLLDIVQGILKNRHAVGVLAINQMNQPSAHRMIKNAMKALEFLGGIDPNKMGAVLSGVTSGLDKASDLPDKPIGLWDLGKSYRDPNINASLSLMLNFLRGMGEGLHQNHDGAESVH